MANFYSMYLYIATFSNELWVFNRFLTVICNTDDKNWIENQESGILLSSDKVLDLVELTDYGPVLLVLLVQHLWVLKMVDQVVQPLQSGICQIADLSLIDEYLLAAELGPTASLKQVVKLS